MSNPVNLLIEKWPSNKELADDLGLRHESHCRVMKVRGRIPRAYWWLMVEAAQRRGIKGVSIARLQKIHTGIGERRS